jgi:hypothetical protein
MQHRAVQCRTLQHSTAQTAQYSTLQHSTDQYNAVQHSEAQWIVAVKATVPHIQGGTGGMCQTSGGCSLC